jgi:hypothetical protein
MLTTKTLKIYTNINTKSMDKIKSEEGWWRKSFEGLYETWESVRKETIAGLGEQTALHIIDFHGNNWIDINIWISSKYSREEQMNIVIFQFSRLFKEIHWLQFLFHNANYPMIYRNLRYILEMMAQAYYVDRKYPNLNLNEQMEKAEIEEAIFGWKLVKPVLSKILNFDKQAIEGKFKNLWDNFNKHSHPSVKQMDIVAKEDFTSLMTDSFNENLAREVLKAVDEIFDLIYMMIFQRFPKIEELALEHKFKNEWKDYLPNTMSIIKSNL